jgi:hypothetical protein
MPVDISIHTIFDALRSGIIFPGHPKEPPEVRQELITEVDFPLGIAVVIKALCKRLQGISRV